MAKNHELIIDHQSSGDQEIVVRTVQPLKSFLVHVTFTDGTERDINLEPYLHGPIFDPIRSNPEMFRRVAVDPEWGCLVWSNGADIDPDSLYYDGPPPWAETDIDGTPLKAK